MPWTLKSSEVGRFRVEMASLPPSRPQVQLHLTRVCGFEVADLQLDGDEPSHAPTEEQQIEIVVVAVEVTRFCPSTKVNPTP
jgi:hypothetical protein